MTLGLIGFTNTLAYNTASSITVVNVYRRVLLTVRLLYPYMTYMRIGRIGFRNTLAYINVASITADKFYRTDPGFPYDC